MAPKKRSVRSKKQKANDNTRKKKVRPGMARLVPAGAAALIIMLAVLGALFMVPVTQKQVMPEPQESNDLVVPVVVRALVLDIPSVYIAAIDSIKSNAEYLKNEVSMQLTIAELQEYGVKDTVAAARLYKELYDTYRNEQFMHRPVSTVRGRMTNEPLSCMLAPELLLRLGNIAAREQKFEEARTYYDKVRTKHKKDLFGYGTLVHYRYADVAALNMELLVSGNGDFVDSCSEADKLAALDALVARFREACVTPDAGQLSRYVAPAIRVVPDRATSMNLTAAEMAAVLGGSTASKERSFLSDALIKPAVKGVLTSNGIRFLYKDQESLFYRVDLSSRAGMLVRWTPEGFYFISIYRK